MKGLYIHIPFCLKKCLYCDFVSYTDCQNLHEKYLSALFDEMKQYAGEKIDTIFIGGGTPTILSPKLLEKLLSFIKDNFIISDDCEFTTEANPKTLTKEKLTVLKSGGINRLSIGVQSFFDNELSAIGRIHSAQDAENTILLAKDCGFDNINIDIMSSLPYQTPDTLIRSVKKAVSLGAVHISCYSLIIEDGTPIAKMYDDGTYKYPSDETDREMYYSVKKMLEDNGFIRYEISNYAKNGAECKHNLKYWQSEDYIGAGAAAHSFLNGRRKSNTSDLKKYISGKYVSEETVLTDKEKTEEFMITGLRTIYGISENEFLNRFNTDIKNIYNKQLEMFIKSGHMVYNNGVYTLTDKGIDVSNSILCEFLL